MQELSFDEKLVRFIVTTNQPFTIVEQPSFRSLFPKETKWMVAKTATGKVLKAFEARKLELCEEIKVKLKFYSVAYYVLNFNEL